jgi:hypothetical protein
MAAMASGDVVRLWAPCLFLIQSAMIKGEEEAE